MPSSLIDAVLENPGPEVDGPVPVTNGEHVGLTEVLTGQRIRGGGGIRWRRW